MTAIAIPDEEDGEPASAMPVSRLSIGEETIEFEIDHLPVRIGRASTNELVVPQSQTTVSGDHLVVHSVTEQGMAIEVTGRWGVTLNGTLHRQSERLVCPWGTPLLLTRPRVGRLPCAVTLLRLV